MSPRQSLQDSKISLKIKSPKLTSSLTPPQKQKNNYVNCHVKSHVIDPRGTVLKKKPIQITQHDVYLDNTDPEKITTSQK